MDATRYEQVMGTVRAGIAAVGGFLVSLGVADDAGVTEATNAFQTAAGSVAVLVTAVWSVYSKLKARWFSKPPVVPPSVLK